MYATGAEATVAVQGPLAISVLIVEDEDATRNLCRDVVVDAGLHARTAAAAEEALEILEQHPVDIVITDLRVPQMGGLELLKHIREVYPQTAVMVLTQYGTIESAVEATRMGAADYVTKPFHIPELRETRSRGAAARSRSGKSRAARAVSHAAGIRGTDRHFDENATGVQADREGEPAQLPGIHLGESGTGKELVARSIHFGTRRNGRSSRWIVRRSFPR